MPRPPQSKLDALFRQLQDEPSHGPTSARYPRPRARKPGDIPTGAAIADFLNGAPPGGAALVSRIWGWMLQTNAANTRSTVVSPGFTTPCMLYQVNHNLPQPITGANGLSLYYGTDNGGAQTGGASTNRPSGTPILQPAGFAASGLTDGDNISEHIPLVGEGGTVTIATHIPTRYVVESGGRVFFKVSLGGSSAADTRVRGLLVVLEAPTVEALLAVA